VSGQFTLSDFQEYIQKVKPNTRSLCTIDQNDKIDKQKFIKKESQETKEGTEVRKKLREEEKRVLTFSVFYVAGCTILY
jgi:hypothetical protein